MVQCAIPANLYAGNGARATAQYAYLANPNVGYGTQVQQAILVNPYIGYGGQCNAPFWPILMLATAPKQQHNVPFQPITMLATAPEQ